MLICHQGPTCWLPYRASPCTRHKHTTAPPSSQGDFFFSPENHPRAISIWEVLAETGRVWPSQGEVAACQDHFCALLMGKGGTDNCFFPFPFLERGQILYSFSDKRSFIRNEKAFASRSQARSPAENFKSTLGSLLALPAQG